MSWLRTIGIGLLILGSGRASANPIRAVLAVFGLLIAAPLSADPITGFYNVHVLERIPASTHKVAPFDATFRLSVTFDDRITSEGSFGDRTLTRTYGPPTFSTIPLLFAARPADDLGFMPFGFTDYTKAFNDGKWLEHGSIEHQIQDPFGPTSYQLVYQLEAIDFAAVAEPDITPSGLLSFLGSGHTGRFGDPLNFLFTGSFQLEDGTFTDDSFTYRGIATTANPTPEPSTIVLVGFGALAIARMVRRAAPLRNGIA
jgi:hypothetical protein